MPWTGSTFSRSHNWTTDQGGGIKITATRHDAEDDNLAAGLNSIIADSIPFTGQIVASGTGTAAAPNFTFNGFEDTGWFGGVGKTNLHGSVDGVEVLEIKQGNIYMSTSGGAFTTPHYTWLGSTTDGLFLHTVANTIGLSTAGNARLTVHAGGNVSIGTNQFTAPSTTLEVAGTAAVTGDVKLGTGSAASVVQIGGDTSTFDATLKFISDATYTAGGLVIERDASAGLNSEATITQRGTGGLTLNSQEAGPITFKTTNVERLTVAAGGTVSVAGALGVGGVTSPETNLEVDTSVLVSSSGSGIIHLEDGASSSTNNRRISFANDDGLRIASRTDTGAFQTQMHIVDTDSGGATMHRQYIQGSEKLRLDSTGLGVGTTTITAALTVNGAVKPASYTVGTVPSASTNGAGSIIYVSNETGGATPAFSDGTNWRRVADRAVIS